MKISYISSAFLSAFILIGCAKKSGTIEGKIIGAEGAIIELHSIQNAKMAKMAEVTADANGSFSFLPQPGLALDFYAIKVAKGNQMMLLLTDSTESVTIEAEVAKMDKPTLIKGSVHTEKLMSVQKELEAITEQLNSLGKPDETGVVRIEANSEYQRLMREKRNIVISLIDNNPQSPACLAAISQLNINQDLDQYLRVKNNLRDVMAGSAYYSLFVTQIDNARAQQSLAKQAPRESAPAAAVPGMISVGDSAPEIAQNNPKGKIMKLSDLKGKVVLIDFWASWCGPCRAENPTVVAAYNKYKSKGFTVFSVSLDQDANRWTAAIQQDGLVWENHVSDLKGWQNSAAQQYKVTSIPRTFLLDKDGKVVASNLRGPDLEVKIKEILGA